jgi:hypothetical protein
MPQILTALTILSIFTSQPITATETPVPREEIIEILGEPNGSLSGFYGDIFNINSETRIIIYYDTDSTIEYIKIGKQVQNDLRPSLEN